MAAGITRDMTYCDVPEGHRQSKIDAAGRIASADDARDPIVPTGTREWRDLVSGSRKASTSSQ
jgi:hypothetical protein